MANLVVVLEQTANNGQIGFRYALRAVPPVARQGFYANSNAKSQWKDCPAGEITSLQSGALVETVRQQNWPTGTSLNVIKSALQAEQVAFQADISGRNDWPYYGTTWDGTAWTNVVTA